MRSPQGISIVTLNRPTSAMLPDTRRHILGDLWERTRLIVVTQAKVLER